MIQQWPKLRYQFLFHHDETKLMMNKQILSIQMLKCVPKLSLVTAWLHVHILRINHLTNSAIPLKITFKKIYKKNISYLAIHIFLFIYIFTLILKMQSNVLQYYPSFYAFYESHFSQVRHPSHPGRGHGSLTCHMTQYVRSDWLRSEHFINIMIECQINNFYID